MEIRINNLNKDVHSRDPSRPVSPFKAAALARATPQSPRADIYEEGQDPAKTPLPQLKMPHFRKDGEPVKLEDIITLEGEVLQLFA